MKAYRSKCLNKKCRLFVYIETDKKPINYMDSGRMYLEYIKCPKCGNMSNFRVME